MTTPLASVSRGRRFANLLGLAFLVVVAVELALRLGGGLLSLDVERPYAPSSQTDAPYTILCVGDSWTAGRADGRYPQMLEERLNGLPVGRKFRVINLGQSGTNSSQALRTLAAHVDQQHVDLAIVMTGNNDHWNLAESAYWQFRSGEQGRIDIATAHARIFLHSLRVYKLGLVLKQMLFGGATPNEFFYGGTDDSGREIPAPLVAIDRETHHRLLEYNLTKFVELARLRGFKLVFQTYFHFHGYDVNEIIRGVAREYGIPVVENNFIFHQRIAVADRGEYLVADGHPNPRGYALIVDNVIDTMTASGMLQASNDAAR
jgi:lysophospholipase L1-like esterase